MEIPNTFRERYEQLVDDPEAFFSCMNTYAPKSFRANTIKSSPDEIRERFESYGIGIRQMPWYEDAFVSEEPEVGGTLEHFTGKIYIQELVSMLPPWALRDELGGFVLDACAAPGSKTTQLSALMQNRGVVIANDLDYGRIKALRFNLEKVGAINALITNQDLRFFPKMEFDSVILDAPCSSEGTIRKNPKLFSSWNERKVRGHSKLQKHLILKAFDLLRPGGAMVYSTCTFAPEENEGVVSYLLEKREAKLEGIPIPGFKTSPGIGEWKKDKFHDEVRKCARIWPHHNDTGGFFMAKVRK
jgi:NOL1/NOP2/sun family putative RNA methylase